MTKADLISALAEENNMSKKEVDEFFNSLANLTYKTLQGKDELTLPGLGKFVVKYREPRMGRNPSTGQQIKIEGKNIAKFKASSSLKEAVE